MKFEPVTTLDKMGRKLMLRSAEVSDAAALIEYLRVTSGETPYLIREPDEVILTLAQEESFIQARENAQRELMLIATVDGEYAGVCSLMSKGNLRRYRHRCEVAVALYQKFHGAGIGKIMLQTVLKAAKQLGYEQAELEVVSDNISAVSLYKKLGFEQYGCLPRNMKYSSGEYADVYWMMKKL